MGGRIVLVSRRLCKEYVGPNAIFSSGLTAFVNSCAEDLFDFAQGLSFPRDGHWALLGCRGLCRAMACDLRFRLLARQRLAARTGCCLSRAALVRQASGLSRPRAWLSFLTRRTGVRNNKAVRIVSQT